MAFPPNRENMPSTKQQSEALIEAFIKEIESSQGPFGRDRNAKRSVIEYGMQVPFKYRSLFFRCAARKASFSQERRGKCHDCVAYENVRYMIGRCTVYTCQHWSKRPYQSKEELDESKVEEN